MSRLFFTYVSDRLATYGFLQQSTASARSPSRHLLEDNEADPWIALKG